MCWRKSNLNCSKCEISAKWPKQSAGLDLNGPKPWLEHMTRVELGAVVLVPPKWRQLADSFVRIRLPGDTYTGPYKQGSWRAKEQTRQGQQPGLPCPGLNQQQAVQDMAKETLQAESQSTCVESTLCSVSVRLCWGKVSSKWFLDTTRPQLSAALNASENPCRLLELSFILDKVDKPKLELPLCSYVCFWIRC